MPDRFEWLEFEEQTAPPARPAQDRDLRGLMVEAARAYAEGDYEGALKKYSEALKSDRALHHAWAGQVRCLVRMDELREAQTWAGRACQLFPGAALLESARAYALACSGLLSEALAASDAALEIAERTGLQEPRLWLDRGACLLADGQKQTSSFCFQKVREHCPNEPDWEQEIALEALRNGDATQALSSLNLVVEKRPQRGYAWLMLARAARQLGLKSRARQAVEQAMALRPGDPKVLEERRLLARPCWIATLVFASDLHPAVVALRRWRDERLLPTPLGRAAAGFYDVTAPLLCGAIARSPRARAWLRRILGELARRV